MDKTKQRIELMEEALSEQGIVPLHALDNALTGELCEIIGSLYRLAQTKYSDEKIKHWVEAGDYRECG